MIISLDGIHMFRKVNVVTELDAKGQYDVFKCTKCGVEGKVRNLTHVIIDGRHKVKGERCTKTKNEYEKEKAVIEYNDAKPYNKECPKCDRKVRAFSEYAEEGSNDIVVIDARCICGFSGFIDLK